MRARLLAGDSAEGGGCATHRWAEWPRDRRGCLAALEVLRSRAADRSSRVAEVDATLGQVVR
jgi:hypothetical protein